MTKGIKTFILPGQELQATEFINQNGVFITVNERHMMPKDGIIILYLEYENYNTDEGCEDVDT